jgi:murein DD-endopeptidase MepM/ murein hydrolase activator NlpD
MVPDDLNQPSPSVTVERMRRRESRQRRARYEARRRRAQRRLHRFALLTVVAAVAVVTLALTAFSDSGADKVAALAPAPAVRLLPAGTPQPVVLAKLGDLRVQMPIPASRVTAIGFHGAGGGTLALDPVGRQANEGLLARLGHKLFGGGGSGPSWYQIGGGQGPRTGGLDVGAPAGTAVYSPVDGRVVGISPYVVDGRSYGSRIDIQPARAPSVVVSLTHVHALPALSVGDELSASQTRVATVADLSGVEKQLLAQYTNDAGNHVSVVARPAAVLALS